MTPDRLLLASIVSVALACPLASNAAPVPITKEQIASAIAKSGTIVSPEQITLFSEVVATTGAPGFTIESMEPWGEKRTRVRLACANHAECLPFFVSIQWPADARSIAVTAQLPVRVPVASPSQPDVASYAVRAGSSAVLLLESGHVHIRIPVLCLENGAIGQTIRVTSRDRKQTYKATITEGAILRGSLS